MTPELLKKPEKLIFFVRADYLTTFKIAIRRNMMPQMHFAS
jgi:hypothetical protein